MIPNRHVGSAGFAVLYAHHHVTLVCMPEQECKHGVFILSHQVGEIYLS